MTRLTIRPAGVADLAEVMSIMRDAFDPAFGEAWNAVQCEAMIGMPGATLWLALADNQPLGFALSRTIAEETELLLIGVNRRKQGQGVGRQLLATVTESAKKSRSSAVFLEVRACNTAIHFYELVGFVQVGSRSAYYRGQDGKFFDACTYRLDLV